MTKSIACGTLPLHKKQELRRIVSVIKKTVGAEMVILFGNYARGDQVEYDYRLDDGTTTEFQSDFDVRVVKESVEAAQVATLATAIRKIEQDDVVTTPVNIIMDGITFLNGQLTLGRSDIVKEGILLYDSMKCSWRKYEH